MYLPSGADEPMVTPAPTPGADLMARLEAQQEVIMRELAEAAKHRQYTTVFGIAGAVFAALRLGIVAFPALQQRRAKQNPAFRKRRSRSR